MSEEEEVVNNVTGGSVAKNITMFEELRQRVQSVVQLTNEQLATRYKELTHRDAPETTREWLLEAVMRQEQVIFYSENKVELPPVVKQNNEDFFSKSVPEKQKRRDKMSDATGTVKKTRRSRNPEEKKKVEEESIAFFDQVLEVMQEMGAADHDEVKTHAKKFYSTFKKSKRIQLVVRRKKRCATVVFWKGNDKDSPDVDIPVGSSKEDIIKIVEEGVKAHLSA